LAHGNRGERKVWPLLVMAAALVLYFQSLLFLKKVPWVADIKTYYLPNWKYLAASLRSGGFSFWCPGIYCGFPLFADSEMGLFYPLNLIFFLLPSTAGFNYCLVFHYLLGGCFAYLYLRRLGCGRPASLFSAVPFVLGGFFLAHMVHPNAVATAAWMPLFLYLLERALGERRFSFYILAGGVLGLQFLSGFLMINLMEVVLAFFYVLFHPAASEPPARGRLASLGGLASAVLLGAGLGMVQNLPSYHLVSNSYRAGGLQGGLSNIGSLPALQVAGILFPRAFGTGVGQGGYLGAWTFEETYGYVGVLPLLFLPAALTKPRRWPSNFFLGTAAVSLLLSLGNRGLLWPLLHRLPGFHVLKGPSRFLLVFNLAVLVLAALGFDRWQKGGVSASSRRRLRKGWLVTAAVILLVAWVPSLLYRFDVLDFRDFATKVCRPFLEGIKRPPSQVLEALARYFTSWHTELLLPLVLLALFLLLIHDTRRAGRPGRSALAVAVFLALVDVVFAASAVVKPVARSKADFSPGIVEFLREEGQDQRVALVKEPGVSRGEFPLSPNQLLPHGVEDAFGFSTIPPARLDRFLGLLNEEQRPESLALLGVGLAFSPLLRVRGVPYDLGFPYRVPAGAGSVRYLSSGQGKTREIRLLLDGAVTQAGPSGRIFIKLNSTRAGRLERLPLLCIDKGAEAGDLLMTVMHNSQPVEMREVSFRSPGYGGGRTAMEIKIRCRLEKMDELLVTTFCQHGLEGTRVVAVSEIDEDGRGVPLAPWPAIHTDGSYAVYRVEGALPFAFSAEEVAWAEDWREAVDTAWDMDPDERKVILVKGEVDPALRDRISDLPSRGTRAMVEVEERSGDRVRLRAIAEEDCVLVVSLDFLPGWRASLDGERIPLFSAYGFLTALYLPAGEHRLDLSYRPPGLAAGGLLSLLSLLAFASLLALLRKRESVPEKTAEAPLPTPSADGGISAFFPCYNDSATIGEVVKKAIRVLGELTPDYEIIIVDDGSKDASHQVLEALAASHPEVRIVRHDRNRGYGAALRSGIRTSTKKWVFYTDSDGQYDVEDLKRLYALSGTADVVNGFKEQRHDPWYRKLLGSTYNFLVRRVFLIPIRDVDCDFRLMRGDLVRSLDLRAEGGSICVELVKKLQAAGATFAETPVRHFPRLEGRSQFFRIRNLLVMVRELASLWWRRLKRGEL